MTTHSFFNSFILSLFISAAALSMASCGGESEQPDDPNAAIANPVAEYGMMPGTFRINDEGTLVRFSQGNLQYHCTSDATLNDWRFAAHQWDVLGKEENEKMENDKECWMDLFFWGTGDNPKVLNVAVDINKYAEWGKNPIKNGANQPNQWRTLTQKEWYYIFHKRNKATQRCGLGTVNGVRGLILLPEEWKQSINVPGFVSCLDKFTMNATQVYRYEDPNGNDHYSDNIYTEEEWKVMEAGGAIFLPAAGEREKLTYTTPVMSVGEGGYYWSATGQGTSAMEAAFNKKSITTGQGPVERKSFGAAVRLVREVQ